jgi:hypothetical protein
MLHEQPLEALRLLLPDLTSEASRVVFRWLEKEIAAAPEPRDLTERLPEAIRLGRDIYNTFHTGFSAFFLAEGAPGARHVKAALRRRLGFWTYPLVEAVLDRIRDRRLHLLDSYCRKYQPSLFAARTFDAGKLGGYFVRVARVESWHVEAGGLGVTQGLHPGVAEIASWTAGEEPDDTPADYRGLAERLQKEYEQLTC